MPSTSRPCASPDQVGWWDISAVHWVIARTKTRSKKSSSGVTRSPSRSVAPRRDWRVSEAAIEAYLGKRVGPLSVFGVVLHEEGFLLVLLREEEEDERGAEQDGDDAGGVRHLVPLQERGLGGGDDLMAVLGVLRGGVGGAGEGLSQLSFDVLADLARFGRRGDRRAGSGGVAGRQQGAEDRLHDRPAARALEGGGSRGHAGALDRHRAGQGVGGRGAGEADADPDQ